MKRRTKRKLKKALSKNIILVILVTGVFSCFLLSTAYSLMISENNLTGTAHILNPENPREDNVCKTAITFDGYYKCDWQEGTNYEITVTNNSDENMSDIVFIFDSADSDAVVNSVTWADINKSGDIYYLSVLGWFLSQQVNHTYLGPGESINMTINVTSSLTFDELMERTYMANCGQDTDTDDTTTKKVTTDHMNMNLGILEQSLDVTSTYVTYNEWIGVYEYIYTITNNTDQVVKSVRLMTYIGDDFEYNGIWEMWTGSVTFNNVNRILNAAFSGLNLQPGETLTTHISFKWTPPEGTATPYPYVDVPIEALAAGVVEQVSTTSSSSSSPMRIRRYSASS